MRFPDSLRPQPKTRYMIVVKHRDIILKYFRHHPHRVWDWTKDKTQASTFASADSARQVSRECLIDRETQVVQQD